MDFRSISEKVYEHTEDKERMEAMNELYYEMAELIKDRMPNIYNEFSERAEDILHELSDEEAEEIVRKMSPYGEHWSRADIYSLLDANGIEPDIDYYLVMNMAYNDYNNTAKMFDVDKAEFYLEIARDFINDEDGVSHKVAKYFKMC